MTKFDYVVTKNRNSYHYVSLNNKNFVSFLPFAGSTYQLISAGVYYKLGKPNMAKRRLRDGAFGLALDITTIATAGAATGIRVAGKGAVNVGKVFGKELGKATGRAIMSGAVWKSVVKSYNEFRKNK